MQSNSVSSETREGRPVFKLRLLFSITYIPPIIYRSSDYHPLPLVGAGRDPDRDFCVTLPCWRVADTHLSRTWPFILLHHLLYPSYPRLNCISKACSPAFDLPRLYILVILLSSMLLCPPGPRLVVYWIDHLMTRSVLLIVIHSLNLVYCLRFNPE